MPSKKNTVKSGEQPQGVSSAADADTSTPEDTGSTQDASSQVTIEDDAKKKIEEAEARQAEALQAVMLLPDFMREQKKFNESVAAQMTEIGQVKNQLQAIVDAYQKNSANVVPQGGSAPQGGSPMFSQPRQPSGNPADLAAYADPLRSGVLGGGGMMPAGAGGSMTGNPMGDMIMNGIISQMFPPQGQGGMGGLGEMIMKMALQSFQDDISLSRDLRAAIKRKITVDVIKDSLGDNTSVPQSQPQTVAPVVASTH